MSVEGGGARFASHYVCAVRPSDETTRLRVTGGLAKASLTASDGEWVVDALDLEEGWSIEFPTADTVPSLSVSADPPRPAAVGPLAIMRDLVRRELSSEPYAVQLSNEYVTGKDGLWAYSAYGIVPTEGRLTGVCVTATFAAEAQPRLESCAWRRTWLLDGGDHAVSFDATRHQRLSRGPMVPFELLPWNLVPGIGDLELSDAEQIRRLHAKYTWCIDQGDDSGLASCFVPDVYTDLEPSPGRVYGRDDLILALGKVRADAILMQHYVTNSTVYLKGNEASMSAYALVPRFVAGRLQPVLRGGHYESRLVRTADGWQFSYFAYRREFMSDDGR